MIHVFHGFLGSKADFEFLLPWSEVKLHDLDSLDKIEINPHDILLGYSMGGRQALELAARVKFQVKRLILLNAHPGLKTQEEKLERNKWENMIEQKMLESDFLNYWNSLPIFKHDLPLRAMTSTKMWRLSQQENYLPEIEKHKDKILWIIGERDEKYLALAQTELMPRNIPCRFMDAGHRLFQHPEKLIHLLKEEGIL